MLHTNDWHFDHTNYLDITYKSCSIECLDSKCLKSLGAKQLIHKEQTEKKRKCSVYHNNNNKTTFNVTIAPKNEIPSGKLSLPLSTQIFSSKTLRIFGIFVRGFWETQLALRQYKGKPKSYISRRERCLKPSHRSGEVGTKILLPGIPELSSFVMTRDGPDIRHFLYPVSGRS